MEKTPRSLFPMLAALALVLGASRGLAAPDEAIRLGLRPIWPDPSNALARLSHEQRWARIDSLEAPLAQGREISAGDRLELVRLLRSSPLTKHRVHALELARQLEGETRRREVILSYQQTFSPWDAEQLLDQWIEEEPRDAEPRLRLGLMRLEEGVDDARESALEQAESCLRRVTELTPSDPEAWRGLAVILVWQNRLEELPALADTLVALTPALAGPYLLRALADEAAGSTYRASAAWEQAFARMDPDTRRHFEDPDRVRIVRPEGLFVDELVVAPPPRRERGWWIRVTEAELLFARPLRGVRGWDTACGQAWMLYGRPKLMRWLPQSDIGFVGGDPDLARYRQKILVQLPFNGQAQHATPDSWLWLVRVSDDFVFPIVFQRETRFATWHFDAKVADRVISHQNERGPVRLESSVPAPGAEDRGVEMAVAVQGFRASGGRLRIEAWVATRAELDTNLDRIRMIVRDVDGQEVERVSQPVDGRHRRDALARAVPGFENLAPGWIHGFGSLLPAGDYLVIVDALDAEGDVRATRDGRVRIDPEVLEREGFDISEPLICDAYSELGGYGDLPPEFVRYARAVVPNPARRLVAGQGEFAVYYEVYGATIDAGGESHLDVDYTVLSARYFDPVVRGAAYVDGELAQPDVHLGFPDSRSGVATGGLVVRGTRFDVSGLAPGAYVLTVRVSDRLAHREAERYVRFEVEGDAER